MKFDQDFCGRYDMNSTLGYVVPLAIFYFAHAYSNGIGMFLKYESVNEYRAGVGFHFVKMISYLTKSDTHMF